MEIDYSMGGVLAKKGPAKGSMRGGRLNVWTVRHKIGLMWSGLLFTGRRVTQYEQFPEGNLDRRRCVRHGDIGSSSRFPVFRFRLRWRWGYWPEPIEHGVLPPLGRTRTGW